MLKNNLLLFFLTSVILTGCAVPETGTVGRTDSTFRNAYTLSLQKDPPRELQSIRLYREGSPENPPIIQLGGNETLVLEFDYLGDSAKQFRAEVSHRNEDWEESPLLPNFYLSGFNTTFISGGLKSLSQRPSYFHFNYVFPNQQLSFRVSGNYLLSVYDYATDELLFALPFFVTENEGVLETRTEEVFARRRDLRRQDQLFSRYIYPDFVEFPQFNLTFRYVQNQFWGRSRKIDFFDTSTQGEIHFHLDQDQAFVSDYTFNLLDLSTLHADGRQILSVEEGPIPPRVILRRDIQNLNPRPAPVRDTRFGFPEDERHASYAEVHFRLETTSEIDSTHRIYLVGDFNNWILNENNRMRYNSNSKWWEGSALIKEGQYSYKYVMLRKEGIDDLSLDQSLIPYGQHYLTMVYFRDPERNYDRLLQVNQIVSD